MYLNVWNQLNLDFQGHPLRLVALPSIIPGKLETFLKGLSTHYLESYGLWMKKRWNSVNLFTMGKVPMPFSYLAPKRPVRIRIWTMPFLCHITIMKLFPSNRDFTLMIQAFRSYPNLETKLSNSIFRLVSKSLTFNGSPFTAGIST